MLLNKRYLVLEDGSVYEGYGFGAEVENSGELVFNTSMTGVQEIITDLSYTDQIITFSYPLIGNTGFNIEDSETINPTVKGVVVREASIHPSNFRTSETIHEYLLRYNIPGITGIDTRSIIRKIRDKGVMKARITNNPNTDDVVKELNEYELRDDHVSRVSTKTPYISTGQGFRVVLMDFGKKENIVRSLNERQCDVTVVPYDTSSEEILRMKPDGIMLSNGPGNPEDVTVAIETIKELVGKVPIFGICLGHQLIGLSQGAKTYKMKFGHRGANQPVKHLATGKVEITTQNHGYAVDKDSLNDTELEVTHIAINDGSVEGMKHKTAPVFSVQHHPEAAAGPHDSSYLFEDFVKMMNDFKEGYYA